MTPEEKQAFIQQQAKQNQRDAAGMKIIWSRHSVVELFNEQWQRREIEQGLRQAVVIEDYPTAHRPLPDYLVLGWLDIKTPFHAVVAIDQANERLLIVTVYQPIREEWENDWKTRRR